MSTTTTAPDTHFTAAETRLFELAEQIRAYQTAKNLSDTKLVRQFSALGSTKTYTKLIKGDASQLKVEEWLPKYEGVMRLIEAQKASDAIEPVIETLGTAHAVIMSGQGLLNHSGTNRLGIIEGDSGSGKTKSLNALAARFPDMVVIAEGTEAWESKTEMLGDLLVSLGVVADVKQLPAAFGPRQRALLTHLKNRRIILAIDEAHHMTGKGLNVIKTILNQTAAAVIIAGQSTLWRKLQANSWQEAKQLRHNRCFFHITFGSPSRDDAEIFIRARATCESFGAKTWDKLLANAADHGGFAYLRDVVVLATGNMPDGEAIDEAAILAAAETIKVRAGGK